MFNLRRTVRECVIVHIYFTISRYFLRVYYFFIIIYMYIFIFFFVFHPFHMIVKVYMMMEFRFSAKRWCIWVKWSGRQREKQTTRYSACIKWAWMIRSFDSRFKWNVLWARTSTKVTMFCFNLDWLFKNKHLKIYLYEWRIKLIWS